jgi:hypothetical protein
MLAARLLAPRRIVSVVAFWFAIGGHVASAEDRANGGSRDESISQSQTAPTQTQCDSAYVFDGVALATIVTNFNRCNPAWSFKVMDAAAGAETFSGIFSLEDAESFAQALTLLTSLRVHRIGKEIRIGSLSSE